MYIYLLFLFSTASQVSELAINLHHILLDTVKMQEFQDVSPSPHTKRAHFINKVLPTSTTSSNHPLSLFLGSRDADGPNVQDL